MNASEQLPRLDYQRLFEILPYSYIVLSTDLTIVEVSSAYLRNTIRKREELIGRKFFRVYLDLAGLRASFEKVIRTKEFDRVVIDKLDIGRTEGDDASYWSATNSPVFDAKGNVEFIIYRLDDVSELVRLKKTSTDSKRVNEGMEQFFFVTLDMLCISGFDGFFKKVNPAFQDVLGYTPEELCEKSYLEFIHPDDIEKTVKEVERQLLANARVLGFENRYKHKNGGYRLLSWKSAPVGAHMYAAARDITELRKAEQDLQDAKAAAESANRELETFSYSVAHDLRSPLRAMAGFSDLVLNDEENRLSDTSKQHLSRINTAANKMGMLVDALLNLSNIKRRHINKQEIDLSQLAKDIVSDYQLMQTSPNLQVVIADGIKAQGDATLLRQALANLINNAFKYSSKNAGPKIEFGFNETSQGRVYFIRDNGVGFDMKYVTKLFGLFERLHTDREFEGSGIGLATVQRILQSHGGRIWAEGVIGQGATFFFTL